MSRRKLPSDFRPISTFDSKKSARFAELNGCPDSPNSPRHHLDGCRPFHKSHLPSQVEIENLGIRSPVSRLKVQLESVALQDRCALGGLRRQKKRHSLPPITSLESDTPAKDVPSRKNSHLKQLKSFNQPTSNGEEALKSTFSCMKERKQDLRVPTISPPKLLLPNAQLPLDNHSKQVLRSNSQTSTTQLSSSSNTRKHCRSTSHSRKVIKGKQQANTTMKPSPPLSSPSTTSPMLPLAPKKNGTSKANSMQAGVDNGHRDPKPVSSSEEIKIKVRRSNHQSQPPVRSKRSIPARSNSQNAGCRPISRPSSQQQQSNCGQHSSSRPQSRSSSNDTRVQSGISHPPSLGSLECEYSGSGGAESGTSRNARFNRRSRYESDEAFQARVAELQKDICGGGTEQQRYMKMHRTYSEAYEKTCVSPDGCYPRIVIGSLGFAKEGSDNFLQMKILDVLQLQDRPASR